MVTADAKPLNRFTVLVEAPEEVFAGANMALMIRASSQDSTDFNKMRMVVRNDDGFEVARASLTGSNVTESAPLEMVMTAPVDAGDHTYRAVLIAAQSDDAEREEAASEFSFRTTQHTVVLNVWELAPAIEADNKFTLTVGVRCVAGCRLSGRPVSIADQEHRTAGSNTLGDEVWPGTTALYYTSLAATAPKEPGSYRFEVHSPHSDVEPPHAAAVLEFAIRVVPAPEHEVTIHAIDKETGSPLKGARVVLHPYRTVTDDKGIARLKVPKGEYNLLVSAHKHSATGWVENVTADVATTAELEVEPPPPSMD
jgi:hypothetical protein